MIEGHADMRCLEHWLVETNGVMGLGCGPDLRRHFESRDTASAKTKERQTMSTSSPTSNWTGFEE